MWYQVIVVEFMDKVLQMVDVDLQAALLAELAANKVQHDIRNQTKNWTQNERPGGVVAENWHQASLQGRGWYLNEWERSDIPEVQLTNTP